MAMRGLPHRRSGRRLAFLAGAAALGALGVGLVSPAGQVHAQASDLDTTAQIQTTETIGTGSAQAAVAIPQAQARAHTIETISADRTAAAQAAAAAEARATAGPADFRAYAKDQVGASQFGCLDKLWTRESGWRSTAQNPVVHRLRHRPAAPLDLVLHRRREDVGRLPPGQCRPHLHRCRLRQPVLGVGARDLPRLVLRE